MQIFYKFIRMLLLLLPLSIMAVSQGAHVQYESVAPINKNMLLLKHDVHQLMSYYSPNAKWWQDKNCVHPGGCIGTEQSVWVWANATFVMVNYQVLTGDNQYQNTIKTIYTANWQHIYPKKYFDDDLWWALALIRVYEVTKDKTVLYKAQKLVGYVEEKGRQKICFGNGGVYWNLAKTEVGTIANMLYIIDNARLYTITHDIKYKMQANHTWNWFRKSGLLKSDYTLSDHYSIENMRCGKRYDWPFTYNVGVLLMALADLSMINNDQSFIAYGVKIAEKSLTAYAKSNIITEYCDDVFECGKNVFLFKGIYVYALAEFASLSKDSDFIYNVRGVLQYNWQNLLQVQRYPRIYAFDWAMPVNYKRKSHMYNPADILSHLAVVYLELANLLLVQGKM